MGVRAVFLVGFMASGKSSVGQELARRLQWSFVDLDDRIATLEHKRVPVIFAGVGEAGFRAAESAALRQLTETLERNTVVALGGGAFVPNENRELLRNWPTVFLHAPADELWRRCGDDPAERPLRKNPEQFTQLYQTRLPFYREATLTIDTMGKDPSGVSAEIEQALQLGQPANAAGANSFPLQSTRSKTGEPR